MSKLLIYIGENERFDFESTVSVISSIDGVSNPKVGAFMGAIFECEYTKSGQSSIVRISPELETIVVDDLGDNSVEFAIEFQKRSSVELHAIDMDYSFNVPLKNISTVPEFRRATGS